MNKNKDIIGIELKALILEDSALDFELTCDQLTEAGYQLYPYHAVNKNEFITLLTEENFSIILSDYNLPDIDAFEALKICNEKCPEVPFICLSGFIDEETAINLLKHGAVDYVLKDRPDRLPFAVLRALSEAKENAKRIKSEKALKESETRFRQVAEGAQEWVWEVNPFGLYTYVSSLSTSLLGYSPEEIINKKYFYDFFVPQSREKYRNDFYNFIPNKESFRNFENENIHRDGRVLTFLTSGSPVFDENGNLSGFRGVTADITKRKQIENDLKESQLNFFRTISDSPIGIRIITVEGKTVYTNKAFLDIYDFNNFEEFINTPAVKRYTKESYLQHLERKNIRKNGGEVFDYKISILRKNNEIRHVKVSRKEIIWNNEKHFQVINIDITEQWKAENELRKLSKAVEQSPVAIYITNPEGVIEYVNPSGTSLSGFFVDELIGKNTRIFGSGEKPQHEYTKLWKTIKSGNIWTGEFHNKRKNGDLYWESASISPIFDSSGQITHFLAIKEDITGRKQSEIALNRSEELLRKFASHLQSVREEEKVALAREIHDDLGQNLVALKIEAGLLKNKTVRINNTEHSEEIIEKFDRMIALIEGTIKTARRIMNGLRPELLEIKGFVGAATTYLQEFEERYQIKCEFVTDKPDIELNSQQSLTLFRILQESLSNIAKHSKATIVTVLLNTESNKLVMEIIDNGTGFDVHNTGRQDSYGMIGMKERVVLLEGKLNVESEIGKGTNIRVSIPWG